MQKISIMSKQDVLLPASTPSGGSSKTSAVDGERDVIETLSHQVCLVLL